MINYTKSLLLLTFIFLTFSSIAQKEDYIWHLGIDQSEEQPGIQAMMINFNNTPFEVLEAELGNGVASNNAAICDQEGNLLFWSNGCSVMNRNQEVMPNGDSLNMDPYKELLGWDNCEKGYPGIQNSLIIPDPGKESGYYLFHKTRRYIQGLDIWIELRHSYIDMELDNGLGDVVYFDFG